MTGPEAMPPARRRPIPGMGTTPTAPPPPAPVVATEPVSSRSSPPAEADQRGATEARAASSSEARVSRPQSPRSAGERHTDDRTGKRQATRGRRPAADYTTTRLVNFRLPVDLHDRYRQLVRDAEQEHPRLRHPSLTELVISLLEEGPETADEVAELIRRKRAAEHGAEG